MTMGVAQEVCYLFLQIFSFERQLALVLTAAVHIFISFISPCPQLSFVDIADATTLVKVFTVLTGLQPGR